MPHVAMDFTDVPSEFQQLEAGVYDALIEEVELKENNNKDGHNIVMGLKVMNEGPMNGRTITAYQSTKKSAAVGMKRLLLSAGIVPGSNGFSTEELVGKVVKIQVVSQPYKDPATGIERPTSKVRDFIPPQA